MQILSLPDDYDGLQWDRQMGDVGVALRIASEQHNLSKNFLGQQARQAQSQNFRNGNQNQGTSVTSFFR